MSGAVGGWLAEPDYGLVATSTAVAGRPVRSLSKGNPEGLPEIVILPGLGAPFYVGPWVEQLAGWTRVTVLDLPGWRKGRARSSPPTVKGIAAVAAQWLDITDKRNVVLIGHSSGAQSAIRTATLVPERLRGVVLAGPTLVPEARKVVALVWRVVGTVLNEDLAELSAVMPSYLRSGGLPLMRLVQSAVKDRPENVMGGLRQSTLVLTGERDRFSPPGWAQHLALLAHGSCLTLSGAHNTCFTFPAEADAAVHQAVLGWAGERPPASTSGPLTEPPTAMER